MSYKFPYQWRLADTVFTKDKGTVFSCFACGGGSTMGYKLAGFDVIGCNEIDPRMMDAYIKNHNPKYSFLEPIQTFKNREDLPSELYNLDILDGSPPCSTFSISGLKEKSYGVEKKFREGQAKQVLDTLFFDFIDLAKKLQPKVVVAENVKGMLMGEAISYVIRVKEEFDMAGYYVQHFLLDSQYMGVPQKRERIFFIALRKDLSEQFLSFVDMFTMQPKLLMEFKEKPIKFKEIRDEVGSTEGLTEWTKERLALMKPSDHNIADITEREYGKRTRFNAALVDDEDVCPTITATEVNYRKYDKMTMTKKDTIKAGSFPEDYDFLKNKPKYIIGMSVPPIMVAQIVNQIYIQWLSKIK